MEQTPTVSVFCCPVSARIPVKYVGTWMELPHDQIFRPPKEGMALSF